MVVMEAPRTVTMNTGNRLWISSEEMSMSIETNPSAQMPAGSAREARSAPAYEDVLRGVGDTAFTLPDPLS
jgi:hypothetical protein